MPRELNKLDSSRVFAEPLEARRLLSALSFESNLYQGSLTYVGSTHAVAEMSVEIAQEDLHGVVTGAIELRFAKHDAVQYSFVARIVHHGLSIDLPSEHAAFEFALNAEPDAPVRVNDSYQYVSISGTAELPELNGKFDLIDPYPVPI